MKRKEDESWESYKERRKKANKLVRAYRRGFLLWNSKKEGPADSRVLTIRSLEMDKKAKKIFENVEF